MREIIHLACTQCKRINYTTMRNKKPGSSRLGLNKYCQWCRKHTAHKEKK